MVSKVCVCAICSLLDEGCLNQFWPFDVLLLIILSFIIIIIYIFLYGICIYQHSMYSLHKIECMIYLKKSKTPKVLENSKLDIYKCPILKFPEGL